MLKLGGSDYQGWCADSPSAGGIVIYRFAYRRIPAPEEGQVEKSIILVAFL
jgi:hypothetical protein